MSTISLSNFIFCESRCIKYSMTDKFGNNSGTIRPLLSNALLANSVGFSSKFTLSKSKYFLSFSSERDETCEYKVSK